MEMMIPHNKPSLGIEEATVIKSVIQSGWIAQGKQVKNFEDEFSNFLSQEFSPSCAVAVSNGTSALYLALASFDIGFGDEVILPTYTCSAVLNAVFMTGAKPVLVDIDSRNLNISFSETVKKINKKTKAIIITHTFGYPVDLDNFLNLGIPVIEDCAQALGSKLCNRYVGTFGDISTFSFYASKVLTTGNGGMVFSKNKKLLAKIKDFREFDCRKNFKPRFNFQMSDIQAAMGRVQLKRLPSFLEKRKTIANKYYNVLSLEKVFPPRDIIGGDPNFFRFLIQTSKPSKIIKYLEKKGIKTIVPIENYELLHNYLKLNKNFFLVSEIISRTTLSLPIYPALSDQEVRYITKALSIFKKII